MRNISVGIGVLLWLTAGALAQPNAQSGIPAITATLNNARFVFVTSYDGDQFSANPLPQDHKAIANVQDAIQKWGRFVVVDSPQQADLILVVQSRASEDVLAVYDAHGSPGNYLWRMMGQNGLQESEAPLVNNLRLAFEKAAQ